HGRHWKRSARPKVPCTALQRQPFAVRSYDPRVPFAIEVTVCAERRASLAVSSSFGGDKLFFAPEIPRRLASGRMAAKIRLTQPEKTRSYRFLPIDIG